MAGPTDSLRRAGNRGRHDANLARDFCRQVGGKVPWINHTVVFFFLFIQNWSNAKDPDSWNAMWFPLEADSLL